jgi:hypothetical protein
MELFRRCAWLSLLLVPLAACNGAGSANGAQSGGNTLVGWQRQSENPLIAPDFTFTTLDFGPADPSVLFDVDDNKWKVWFSSTVRDVESGTNAMTIRYAESPDGVHWSTPKTVLSTSTEPTAWDYTNVETPTVIKNPDPAAPADKKFMLWYSGANEGLAVAQQRLAKPTYYQIGLAYSADGRSFTRYAPGINGQPGLVVVPSAALFGAGLPGVYGDGVVADPSVVYRNGKFHMWFSSYAETAPDPVAPGVRTPLASGIAHMVSSDGVNWSAPHSNPLASLRKPGELGGGQQPSVLYNPNSRKFEMWFSNDSAAERSAIPCAFNTVTGFWHAVSDDGVSWTPDYSKRVITYDANHGYEALGFLTGIDVVLVGNQYVAYYAAWGNDKNPQPDLYFCPNSSGTFTTAVVTLNRASSNGRQ